MSLNTGASTEEEEEEEGGAPSWPSSVRLLGCNYPLGRRITLNRLNPYGVLIQEEPPDEAWIYIIFRIAAAISLHRSQVCLPLINPGRGGRDVNSDGKTGVTRRCVGSGWGGGRGGTVLVIEFWITMPPSSVRGYENLISRAESRELRDGKRGGEGEKARNVHICLKALLEVGFVLFFFFFLSFLGRGIEESFVQGE